MNAWFLKVNNQKRAMAHIVRQLKFIVHSFYTFYQLSLGLASSMQFSAQAKNF